MLSSNMTLFWRVFIPVFGTVFLLGLTLAVWLLDEDDLDVMHISAWGGRLIMFVLLIGWIWFVWRYLLQLKRVDGSDTHVFVTNYWITVKYPWEDVADITESRRMGRRILHLQLKASGRFGQTISFLPASHADAWLAAHGWDQFATKS